MSARLDTDTDRLYTLANHPSPTSYTCCGWSKIRTFRSGGYQPIVTFAAGFLAQFHELWFKTDNNFYLSVNGADTVFSSNPSTSGWFAWALSCAGTAASDLKGYWRNNADAGWTTANRTGVSFTAAEFYLANIDGVQYSDVEMRYFRQWDAVLSSSELLAESLSATVVRTSNLRRNLPIAAAASAGTDSSGNGYNLTATGLVDGASEPTFPALVKGRRNPMGLGSKVGSRQAYV